MAGLNASTTMQGDGSVMIRWDQLIPATGYVAWAFGRRLREAGLLASMGSVGDALDNSVAESFFASMQTELLEFKNYEFNEIDFLEYS